MPHQIDTSLRFVRAARPYFRRAVLLRLAVFLLVALSVVWLLVARAHVELRATARDESNRNVQNLAHAFAEEVRRQIDRMGLQSRIQWTGREASEAISADLNAVDICLLPYADGASLRRGTLMAALANGCAIVTTAPQTPIANLRDIH